METHHRSYVSAHAFYDLTYSETNPRVLIAALNNIPNIDQEGPNYHAVLSSVDNLINYKNSDFISGNALVTKARLTQDARDIKDDLISAISHSSPEMKSYGLRALEFIMNKDIETTDISWTLSADIRTVLSEIKNNPDTPQDQRNIVLDLLDLSEHIYQ